MRVEHAMLRNVFFCAILLFFISCDLSKLAWADSVSDEQWILIWGGGRRPEDAAVFSVLFDWSRPTIEKLGVSLPSAYPKAVVSDKIRGLNPGYYIWVIGVCNKEGKENVIKRLQPFFGGLYSKRITGSTLAWGCPSLKDIPVQDTAGIIKRGRREISQKMRKLIDGKISLPPGLFRLDRRMLCLAAWGIPCKQAQSDYHEQLSGSFRKACGTISDISEYTPRLVDGNRDEDSWVLTVCRYEYGEFLIARMKDTPWQLVDVYKNESLFRQYSSSLDYYVSTKSNFCVEKSTPTNVTMYEDVSYDSKLICYHASNNNKTIRRLRGHLPVVEKMMVWLEAASDEEASACYGACEEGDRECEDECEAEYGDPSTKTKQLLASYCLSPAKDGEDVLCVGGEILGKKQRDRAYRITNGRLKMFHSQDGWHCKSCDLFAMVKRGYCNELKQYSKSCDIHQRNEKGQTLIHAAALYGRPKCLETLVKLGVKVNVLDKERNSPLTMVEVGRAMLESASRYDSIPNPIPNPYDYIKIVEEPVRQTHGFQDATTPAECQLKKVERY